MTWLSGSNAAWLQRQSVPAAAGPGGRPRYEEAQDEVALPYFGVGISGVSSLYPIVV